MTRISLLAAAAAPLIWASAASAMPMAPVNPSSHIVEARTICDPTGRCCATGSGQCYYPARPRPQIYVERPRYYGPPAYGYRERYREPHYYGGY